MVIQVYALTSKAEEAEVERFYEGHKDFFFFHLILLVGG